MEEQLQPITAKKWILDHFDQYGLGFTEKNEMLGLLNILQAAGENLDSFHNTVCNGHREFMDILNMRHGWDSDRDLYEAVMSYNQFYTEEEFIGYMLERIQDLKDEGEEDPAAVIHAWTYPGEITDTMVYHTEDGYVVRVWY